MKFYVVFLDTVYVINGQPGREVCGSCQ